MHVTLLERVKGSVLDVTTDCNAPIGTMQLISPCTQQIAPLGFMESYWQDIIAFSEFISGQLPLLCTLKISSLEGFDSHRQHITVIPPSLPLFRGSTNLQEFVFCSLKLSSLSYFVFPNLTMLKLLSTTAEECNASCLLNFLKASPMLETVEMMISAEIVLESVPQETVVILPNVESFSLHMIVANGTMLQIYNIAAHISCPCAEFTYLMHDMRDEDISTNLEVFPTTDSWNRIFCQYAVGHRINHSIIYAFLP